MTNKNNPALFFTYDLGCAATLVSLGYDLDSLDKSNPRKVNFVFCWKSGIEKTVNLYWSNQLDIKARSLFDNIKMLKNRIYSS